MKAKMKQINSETVEKFNQKLYEHLSESSEIFLTKFLSIFFPKKKIEVKSKGI